MSALQAIRRFRLHELRGLQGHIQRFGPLSSPSKLESPTDSAPQAQNSPDTILPNPFLPRLNPKTGRWAPPKYSLRRQAELIKSAKASNTLKLLPSGPKFVQPRTAPATSKWLLANNGVSKVKLRGSWAAPVEWDGRVKENGRVPGTNIATLYSGKKRMFKGHKWERTMAARERKRKVLMRDMSKRVARFKEHYKRKKPNPLKPPRSAKAPKLPF